ncbi:hypothetical protein A2U01_0082106, partial [Trifolium medium]|nr:hypothetical protein [Trifolium medium]
MEYWMNSTCARKVELKSDITNLLCDAKGSKETLGKFLEAVSRNGNLSIRTQLDQDEITLSKGVGNA